MSSWSATLAVLVTALGGCGGEETFTIHQIAALETPRAAHTATALADGRVLIAGGCVTDGCGTATDTTEVYDARAARFSPGPGLTGPRDSQTATRLRNGRVLLVGGYAGEGASAPARRCARGARATRRRCSATAGCWSSAATTPAAARSQPPNRSSGV